MPLADPPAPQRLRRLASKRLAGMSLHRVFRADRSSPWWFASLTPDAGAGAGGRFDLPLPYGACYLATSPLAAVLEAFQDYGEGLLPDAELRRRALATAVAPASAPPAAWLTAARARGLGVTAALWAGQDRALTQAWAAALHDAGWQALYHGIQHDPEGRMRALTLLDTAGEHAPYHDARRWRHSVAALHDDPALRAGLARYGVRVARSDPELAVISLEESGLWEDDS